VLRLIDAKGNVSVDALSRAKRDLYEAQRERSSLGGDTEERTRELDFVQFQIDELEGASIRSARELDETLEELTRLTELRDGQASLVEALDYLDADGDVAVLAQFARAISHLPVGESYDDARSSLRNALEQAREAVHDLAALSEPESFDASALKELEDRATVLQALARKYGSLSNALTTLSDLHARQLSLLEATTRTATLGEEIDALTSRVATLADEALRERTTAAESLSAAVAGQLSRVALAHAALRFCVAGNDGSEAQILFTPNPGQPEGPLQALASGGELSRVLLALSLESAHEDVVAVFDEVDAGVGGQVAQQIGECLRELGQHQQVLAVTHLASVAAKADHHFVIEKQIGRDKVGTSVRALSGEERVEEIARMLAGDKITVESRRWRSRCWKHRVNSSVKSHGVAMLVFRGSGGLRMTKFVFVTGGVSSSLGKGLTASSLGRLLKSRGLKVTMCKLDPYLNVDPGTMNPGEHGEVSSPTTGAKPTWTSATMNGSSTSRSPRCPTPRPDRLLERDRQGTPR